MEKQEKQKPPDLQFPPSLPPKPPYGSVATGTDSPSDSVTSGLLNSAHRSLSEIVFENPSHFILNSEIPFVSLALTMCWNDSTRDEAIVAHAIFLPLLTCSIMISILNVGEFLGFGTGESNEYTNTGFSVLGHHLFVKITLLPIFYSNTYYMFSIMPIRPNLFQILQIFVNYYVWEFIIRVIPTLLG
jgi:hypothetical protein